MRPKFGVSVAGSFTVSLAAMRSTYGQQLVDSILKISASGLLSQAEKLVLVGEWQRESLLIALQDRRIVHRSPDSARLEICCLLQDITCCIGGPCKEDPVCLGTDD